MSTTTDKNADTTATTKKKGTTDPATPKLDTYLVNARYNYPHFGGLPFPPGLSIHGFVTFKMKETAPGKGITEKRAKEFAIKHGALEAGLTIEGLSLLPVGW